MTCSAGCGCTRPGFAVFVLGSVLCALSWDAASLIGFRATSGAIVAELYPAAERGRAYGFNAFGFSLGSVVGVLDHPADRGGRAGARPADAARPRQADPPAAGLPGMATLGAGPFLVLWAMTEPAAEPVNGPAVTPSLLQGPGSFAVPFLVIRYLQRPRGLSAIEASLLLLPGYVVGAAAGPYAGRLADRLGPVLPATAGLGLSVVALVIFARMTATGSLWPAVVGNVVLMIGGSFFSPANSSAVVKAAPPERLACSGGSPVSAWCSRSPRPCWSPRTRSRAARRSPSSSAPRACTARKPEGGVLRDDRDHGAGRRLRTPRPSAPPRRDRTPPGRAAPSAARPVGSSLPAAQAQNVAESLNPQVRAHAAPGTRTSESISAASTA
ncbi:MAG: hypothetical protein QOI78_6568 [Actinomycetota bacterium]|nr:hypothetical protein [Actinomycetota bacterium]